MNTTLEVPSPGAPDQPLPSPGGPETPDTPAVPEPAPPVEPEPGTPDVPQTDPRGPETPPDSPPQETGT